MPQLRAHDHVGIIVPEVRAARLRFTELLGVEWGPVMHMAEVAYRDGAGTDLRLPTTLSYSLGDPCIELIEETPGTVWVRNEHSNLHHGLDDFGVRVELVDATVRDAMAFLFQPDPDTR